MFVTFKEGFACGKECLSWMLIFEKAQYHSEHQASSSSWIINQKSLVSDQQIQNVFTRADKR